MKQVAEGIIDKVTIAQGREVGYYVMLITNDHRLLCECESGVDFMWLIGQTEWKVHFLLGFIKAGWFRYRFQVMHMVSGDVFDVFTEKGFGKCLLSLIQSQQLLTPSSH